MFQRLLLGIDDTSAGQIAVSFATALSRQHAATVRVLYVNQFILGGRGHTLLSAEEADQLVGSAVEELRSNGVPATGQVLRAAYFDVALRIAEAADGWPADAIVVGSHRHRRFRRLAHQGVRERVIRLSALPVLTAPAPLKVSRAYPAIAGSPPQPISRRI